MAFQTTLRDKTSAGSITPTGHIRAGRCCLCDAIQDFWQIHRVVMQARQIIWKRWVSVPAVLRPIAVFHFAIVRWIRSALEKVFHQINCIIEEVGISAAAINVYFALKFWSEGGPIPFQDIAKIVMLLPVRGYVRINLARF